MVQRQRSKRDAETKRQSDPASIAAGFLQELGLAELYVADLDAIETKPPSLDLYRTLRDAGHRLWLDAGIDSIGKARRVASQADILILGLESLTGPRLLGEITHSVGPERLAFSLDLRQGVPILATGSDWPSDDPEALVEAALAAGIRRVILLDLARVGMGGGVGTTGLLAKLARYREVEWIVGGGISSIEEVQELGRSGASAVLVGSALHDGRIGRGEIGSLPLHTAQLPE